MLAVEKGRYRARRADNPQDVVRIQSFRSACFGLGVRPDCDALDERCEHVVIETRDDAALVAAFRLSVSDGKGLQSGYAAQFYNLQALQNYRGTILELGRLCTDPGITDPDILRLVWQIITAHVDQHDVGMLCGCASFAGTDPRAYETVFGLLGRAYGAPERWAPRIKAGEVIRFADVPENGADRLQHQTAMPPLLRSYLSMGARVSDHAVIDRQLNTLHVFTGLEVDAIPAARKRLLRAL